MAELHRRCARCHRAGRRPGVGMTTEIPDDGPVERYLDTMFDRLTGTGAAGRRMLAEAENHLLTATAEGRASGLDPETAEQQAVERFGPVDDLARQVPV